MSRGSSSSVSAKGFMLLLGDAAMSWSYLNLRQVAQAVMHQVISLIATSAASASPIADKGLPVRPSQQGGKGNLQAHTLMWMSILVTLRLRVLRESTCNERISVVAQIDHVVHLGYNTLQLLYTQFRTRDAQN